MMNLFFKINIFVFILSLYSLSIGQEKKITVSGTVIDSITGDPVPDVLILLTDNVSDIMNGNVNSIVNSVMNNNQSITSDNSGKFSAEISVNQTSFLLAGVFVKGDYQIKVQTATILIDKADFNTIKMIKEEFRDVEISGTIKDSLTDQPVSGATVYLTNTSIIIDSVFYILTTDDQGRFSQKMKIGKGGILPPLISSPLILYTVHKTEYDTLMNMAPDNGNSKIDLGTIYIFNRNAPVKNISIIKNELSKPKPSSVFIYSLNGKLLYSGPEVNIALLRNKDRLSSRPVVIKYKYSYSNPKERLLNLIE